MTRRDGCEPAAVAAGLQATQAKQQAVTGHPAAGHVYCYDCLVEAVRAQKKCPTCRKGMQLRSIHKVFVNFS